MINIFILEGEDVKPWVSKSQTADDSADNSIKDIREIGISSDSNLLKNFFKSPSLVVIDGLKNPIDKKHLEKYAEKTNGGVLVVYEKNIRFASPENEYFGMLEKLPPEIGLELLELIGRREKSPAYM